MPSWPPTIGFFLDRSGYSVGDALGSNIIRTQMDIGPPKVRRRSSAGPRKVEATTDTLSSAQVDQFDDFVHDDLADGALRFDATDQRTGDTREYRLLSYTIRPRGLGWVISAQLERLP